MPLSCTCLVSFKTPAGAMYAHVTGGRSLFDAVSNALQWFEDDHWKGPRPRDETVFDVTFVGNEERYFVRCGRVRAWQATEPEGSQA